MQSVTSQNDTTTVRIPLKTANAIINDLEAYDSLKVESRLNNLIIGKLKAKERSYISSLERKDLQINLLKENFDISQETYKKTFWDKALNTLKDIAIGSAIFAVGFVVGSL